MAEVLTDAERLERIGALLAVGVGRLLLRKQANRDLAAHKTECNQKAKQERKLLPKELTDLFAFISRVHVVSPSEVRKRFHLSRTTAYRRLRSLEDRGLIVRNGSSRGTTYQLAA